MGGRPGRKEAALSLPPLLLVNGYAATGDDWDPTFVGALERSFEVIRPDHRAADTIDGMAAGLERLLDERGLESVAVAGWSMGGFVAQRLTIRAPARVTSLALLSTDPGGPEAARADPRVWARLTDRSGIPREQASRLISLLFPPALAPDVDERFGDVVATARAMLSPEELDAQEAAMDAWHREEQPRPGPDAPPVLAMCGEEDVVIPPENAERLAARWPDCRVERFPGAAHAFMAQEPERAAALIAQSRRSDSNR